jgi:hypothetical protein
MNHDNTNIPTEAEVQALQDAAVILGGAVMDAEAALYFTLQAEKRARTAYLDAARMAHVKATRSVADIGKGQTLDDLTVQDFDRVTAERQRGNN